jgi:tetratricopeptide (TPR) repeat protein
LWFASGVGAALRSLTPTVLRVGIFVASAALVGIALWSDDPLLAVIPAGALIASILEARSFARSRVVVGGFANATASSAANTAGIAELLRIELARLADLFQTVGGRRAVSSGIGPKRALDATPSVDNVASALQAAVSAESKVSVGPVAIPARLLIAVVDRVIRPPRLSGSLHVDETGLILTAHQDGLDGLSWRVPPESPNRVVTGDPDTWRAGEEDGLTPDPVSIMVRELALRIFTDVALGRHVRWQASEHFVLGLDRVRACLRAPTDRKVNLRKAEGHFLKTLSEDEDFPHAYYNLGVVYNELFNLAWTAGRTFEARNHLRAAEISFGRAIEREPQRWENYFALAQTHFQNCRFDVVTDLCTRMLELTRSLVDRAKIRELRASALLATRKSQDVAHSSAEARRSVRLSVVAALRSRLLPRFWSTEDELAAACLQTFGATQAAYGLAPSVRTWRRVQAIYAQARRLADQDVELHLELGLMALGADNAALAEAELSAAVRRDPARPLSLAALAEARAVARVATNGASDGQPVHPEHDEIAELCRRSGESMSRAYAPARDGVACTLIRRAARVLGDNQLCVVADELCNARDIADRRLAGPLPGARCNGWNVDAEREQQPSVFVLERERERERERGAIVSAAFLQALPVHSNAEDVLDEYGVAVQDAQSLLEALRGESKDSDLSSRPRDQLQQAALTQGELATALNPLSVLAWITLGDIQQEFADFTNAQEAWGNALTQDPDNPALYDRVGTSWWHLAFQGRSRPSEPALLAAKEYFEKALLLYESGRFVDQIRTRYRLAKLYAALRDFDRALAQLRVVAVVSDPPIVGWTLLGLAYLSGRDYSECEYFFGRVIECGATLDAGQPIKRLKQGEIDPVAKKSQRPDLIIGNRIDERWWPLGLIRAWGYLGMAFSYVERDGDLEKAQALIESARSLALSPKLTVKSFPRASSRPVTTARDTSCSSEARPTGPPSAWRRP